MSALWRLGFRPFFLLGLASGILSISLWLLSFAFGRSPITIDVNWHAHEMIHGFVIAVVIGFLYTASQNWTGIQGIHGTRLKVVVAVWLAGRAVFLLPNVSRTVVACIDLSFLPLATGMLAPYLLNANQRKNAGFVVLLGLLWLTNFSYHLDALDWWPGAGQPSYYAAIDIVILMITLIGGRVIPLFSRNAISGYSKPTTSPALNIATIASTAGFAVVHLAAPDTYLMSTSAILAGSLHLIRFLGWCDRRIWKNPILWILYVGYAWLIVAFYLSGVTALGFFRQFSTVHAFTAGAITTMIVAMVSRVSLGHSGRLIRASRWTVAAYVLVTVSAIVRVFGPAAGPDYYLFLIKISGSLWVAALFLILLTYAPIWWTPRVDGRPG